MSPWHQAKTSCAYKQRTFILPIDTCGVLGFNPKALNFWLLLLQERQQPLRLGRSRVQGWGLYAEEPVPPESFVIEYVGERIRNVLADLREKVQPHMKSCSLCRFLCGRYDPHSNQTPRVPRVQKCSGSSTSTSRAQLQALSATVYQGLFQSSLAVCTGIRQAQLQWRVPLSTGPGLGHRRHHQGGFSTAFLVTAGVFCAFAGTGSCVAPPPGFCMQNSRRRLFVCLVCLCPLRVTRCAAICCRVASRASSTIPATPTATPRHVP